MYSKTRQLVQDLKPLHFYLIFTIAAILVPLCYALYTNHIWEDFFITFRHSKNLVDGHGLVFQPGEYVHGFTSPINVLLPAIFYWLTDKAFYPALWLYRIVSILAFASAGLVVVRAMIREKDFNKTSILFFIAYFILEIKSVAFSTNGQEAGFMLLFLMPAFVVAYIGITKHWFLVGLCWAGLMWTRPDGCVYIAVLSFVGFIFSNNNKKEELIAIMKAACVCAVLYLPWFIWAWVYYGNPTPHTVIAKAVNPNLANLDFIQLLERILAHFPQRMRLVFEPVNSIFPGWPTWIKLVSFPCALFCSVYWLIPTKDRLGRMASLVFTLSFVYLSYVSVKNFISSWYLPPVAICGMIVLSRGFMQISNHFDHKYHCKKLAYGINIILTLGFLSMFVMSTMQLRIQQKEIEFGNRKVMGLWLKDNIEKGDSIYLEPLGYIGYFSEAKMLDFPGLVAPEVVKLRKEKNLNFDTIIPELKPDWIVVRPIELQNISQIKSIRDNYKIVKTFDVTENLKKYSYIPGIGYLLVDAKFFILKKNRDV